MPDFEHDVLSKLDTVGDRLTSIDERLDAIELRVQGATGDPNNQGIAGKLKTVDNELVGINDRQRRLTDDVKLVKEDQMKQRAWLRGIGVGLAVTGVTGVTTLARMIGG